MKKIKLDKKKKSAIMIIVITVFIIIISVAMREASYTQTWVSCEIDHEEHYHETIRIRFDINDKMYGFYREEYLHDLSEDTIEANYREKKAERDKVEEQLSDNFMYDLDKKENSLTIKTYIGVSVYTNFYNNYIGTDGLSASKSIDEVKVFLENNGYKCETYRK